MEINMIRRHGDNGLPLIECCNTKLQKYRVRTDFQPYIDPMTKEESGVTFIETEFPYKPSMSEVKDFVLEVINSQTDYKILTAFQWTLTKGWKMENGQKVDLTGEPVNVWLSNENQNNYSEGHSIAEKHADEFLPITYKVSEDGADTAIYEDFEDFETLDRFYLSAAAFKNNTLKEGWARKDAIDWTSYQEALEPIDNVEQ